MRSLTILLTIALSKLNNAEYLNLMSRLQKLVETATPTAVGLTADEFDEFKALVDQLQDRINYTTASDRTALLDTLDSQRDSVLTFLFSTINNSAKMPIEAQSAARSRRKAPPAVPWPGSPTPIRASKATRTSRRRSRSRAC